MSGDKIELDSYLINTKNIFCAESVLLFFENLFTQNRRNGNGKKMAKKQYKETRSSLQKVHSLIQKQKS